LNCVSPQYNNYLKSTHPSIIIGMLNVVQKTRKRDRMDE
jgi:hypothetical protein